MGFLKYKGYTGTIDYTPEDGCLFGVVLGLHGVSISYEGDTIAELKADFEAGIDDYLDDCASEGKEPQKPYSGKISLRMSSDMHQRVAQEANNKGESINAYILAAIESSIAQGRSMYSGVR